MSSGNGLTLRFSTNLLPSAPVTGRTYRFKYTATNIAGESELSDELSVLLAEVPSISLNLHRIDSATLPAGQIRVTWDMPADDGGSPITGYRLYLNDVLVYDGNQLSTEVVYTLINLNVGLDYKISVSAMNAKGEGLSRADITLTAASHPQKMNKPFLKAATSTSITVEWSSTDFFNGGAPVTNYAVRRDDGPNTEFESQFTTSDATSTYHQFVGLDTSKLIYRFQVAAINSIGQGPQWSEAVSFYTADVPSDPLSFSVVSQSQSAITLNWMPPASDGGCDIEGYRIYMEDILLPGFVLVYNGLTLSTVTQFTIANPDIEPSKYYKFKI